MRAVVQRILSGSVEVNGTVVGKCGVGLCLLVAVHRDDEEANARKMAQKIVNLRVFNDSEGRINLSALDLQGQGAPCGILAVSNFTVYGDASRSRRPSFTESAPFEVGKSIFEYLLQGLGSSGLPVETGEFGADMKVSLVNDGPVTIIVET
jgi:D-tyrosyl-tRNA(Tyr) deacylase